MMEEHADGECGYTGLSAGRVTVISNIRILYVPIYPYTPIPNETRIGRYIGYTVVRR
jgi:hypothetical protein